MLKSTFRGMIAHKLRLVLTTASISLGVAFLAGTLILTDTMGIAFEQLFGKVSAGTDAVVRTEASYTQPPRGSAPAGPHRREGARRGQGRRRRPRPPRGLVSGYALITDNDGQGRSSPRAAPRPGLQHGGRREPPRRRRAAVRRRAGGLGRGRHRRRPAPRRTTSSSVRRSRCSSRATTQEFTVVGTVGFGGEKDLGGTTSAYFDTDTAQRLRRHSRLLRHDQRERGRRRQPGRARGRPGRDRSRRYRGRQRPTVSKENADAIKKDMKMVRHPVHDLRRHRAVRRCLHHLEHLHDDRHAALAGDRVAAGRRRHPAPGRARPALRGRPAGPRRLGARPRPRPRCRQGAEGPDGRSVGFSLPSTSLQVEPRTVVVSLLVGALVTVVAAIVPARRATKVLPIEALRDATPGAEKPTKRRAVIGLTLVAAGVAGVLAQPVRRRAMKLFGLGLAAGAARRDRSLPLAVRPLAALIAAPMQVAWPAGRAGEAERDAQPASYRFDGCGTHDRPHARHQHERLRRLVEGLVRRGDRGQDRTRISTSRGPACRARGSARPSSTRSRTCRGVDTVSASGWGQARFDGEESTYSAVDPATAGDLMKLDVVEGSLERPRRGLRRGVGSTATAKGWQLGDTVRRSSPRPGSTSSRSSGSMIQGMGRGRLRGEPGGADRLRGDSLVAVGLVSSHAGADLDAVQGAIDSGAGGPPGRQGARPGRFEKEASGSIDSC